MPVSMALYAAGDALCGRAPGAPVDGLSVQRCLTCTQSTSGRMTRVATTAIDRATMVVTMSGLVDHVDDEDDDDKVEDDVRGWFSASLYSFADTLELGDCLVCGQPVLDACILA